ncbi:uroporphyrinogen-III C-methyltransferase [Synechococcus sp. PCC 7336]|uniref:uroporphyrinogen-III C-methyltransferase n=1 Tax=Synechococcus sp. PCC 7336 TaxID=195250 RepID=UPI0003487F6F|nr:uroporphyrinogen-III C-methyltransferase [Synechococcus sp. PCC 7336]
MGNRASAGKVYLVGTGLGGLDTLTLRAWEILQRAEVAIADDLVGPQVLAALPDHCELIRAGKRGGRPSTKQAEIDRLAVSRARAGLRVVRLKSGDPGMFGRLVEEVRALRAAGCACEIVPGISAAISGSLMAGIPLTEKTLSRSVTVATAHDLDALPWGALAQLDTVVFLMGTRGLAQLCDRLVAAGKDPATAIALVRHAGRPEQQVWTGELASFARQMASLAAPLSPAVIVVGETVRLRDDIHMTGKTPLAGKTVVVTRANAQSGALVRQLQDLGAVVADMPTLEIVPPSDLGPLDEAIAQLSAFGWLVLASGNGVRAFFERLQATELDSRALHSVKVAVVGRKTAEVLQEYGIRPDFIPPEFVADALAETLPLSGGDRILFPRVESGGRATLIRDLAARGAQVAEVAAYQSRCPDRIDPAVLALLQHQQVDVLTFASSKTVLHFHQLLTNEEFDFNLLDRAKIAAIGPKTAETCDDLLGRTDICASEYTLNGLVEAVVQFYR